MKPITVLHGPNFSGKTRVLRAVRLGLLGYDPLIGKTERAIMKLASANTLSIEIGCNTDTLASRKWIRNDKGACQSNTTLVSDTLQNFPDVLLDLNAGFLGKTAAQRIQHVFSLDQSCTVESAKKAVLLAIQPDQIWPDGDDQKQALADSIRTVTECVRPSAQSVFIDLAVVFDALRGDADRKVKSFKGADTANSILSSQDAVPQNKETELAQARTDLQAERDRYRQLKAANKSSRLTGIATRIGELTAEISNLEDEIGENQANRQALSTRKITDKCDACGQKLPTTKIKAQTAKIQEEIAALDAAAPRLKKALVKKQAEIADLEAEQTKLQKAQPATPAAPCVV